MADRTFDRETVLNLVVNMVPLGMILFFIFLFLVSDVFGSDVVAVSLSQLLLVVPFVALALVTYISGRIITETERTGHSDTAAAITRVIVGDVSNESASDESETE
jgi:uncharacterized membrane protein